MPSTPRSIISSKKRRTLCGIGAVEERGIGRYAEAALQGELDGFDGFVISAFAANSEIVFLALAIHVYGEGQVFAGRELVQLFFEQQRVGAQVDVFLARDQAVHDFGDLGMHQRLAAGDADHGRAAFFDGAEAFLGGELLLQNMGGILNFAAASAGEITAEQRLQHQDERIVLAALQPLADDVGGRRPHL